MKTAFILMILLYTNNGFTQHSLDSSVIGLYEYTRAGALAPKEILSKQVSCQDTPTARPTHLGNDCDSKTVYCAYSSVRCVLTPLNPSKASAKQLIPDFLANFKCDVGKNNVCPSMKECKAAGLSDKTRKALAELETKNIKSFDGGSNSNETSERKGGVR